jgi:hypothetical protein
MPYEEEDACLYSIVLPYSGTPTQNTLLRGGGCEGADEAAGDDPAACVCVCVCVCVCLTYVCTTYRHKGSYVF